MLIMDVLGLLVGIRSGWWLRLGLKGGGGGGV